ncbi:MAG: hypothetical protein WDM79_11740 [Terricaulis sp.]
MLTKRIFIALAAAGLAACASAPPIEPVREARVIARDSTHFARQADGSWVEISHAGLARFRFTHERDEGDVAIVFDESRNVRLRIDPAARTITEAGQQGWRPLYDISEVVRGAVAPAPRTNPIRVWLDGGGAFVRDGASWAQLSPIDGFPPAERWREQSHDADTITLALDTREVRIELGEGLVHGLNAATTRIRAVDY